jgi:hypothetical protein
VFEGGNREIEDELREGFENLNKNNMYKQPGYLRLSKNNEDRIIQQIFKNESRNVIDPQLLYSAIRPHHNSLVVPQPISAPFISPSDKHKGITNHNIGRSVLYQDSANHLSPSHNYNHNYP